MKRSVSYSEYAAAFGRRHMATFGRLRVCVWVVRRFRGRVSRSTLRRLMTSAVAHWRHDYAAWRRYAG